MKYIAILLLLLAGNASGASAVQRINRAQPVQTPVSVCTNRIQQTSADDARYNFNILSQKLNVTSNFTICRIDIAIKNVSAAGTMSIRTDKNGGGTLLGTSGTGVSTGTSGPVSTTWYSYEFVTPVAVTNDVYLTKNSTGATVNWGWSSTNPYNPGATYNAFDGNTEQTGYDFTFKVYQQESQ